MDTSLSVGGTPRIVLAETNKRETLGVTGHFQDRILSIATFGLVGILVVTANAKPVQNVTNPFTAKQVQSMLHPSPSAIPHTLFSSTARSTIDRLLGPQLKKLGDGPELRSH